MHARRAGALYRVRREPAELIRNFRSINIDLTPHLEKDLLRIHASRPEAHSADDYAGLWEQAVDAWGATCLVIDPFSALLKAGGELAAILVATEIIRAAKARKITVVATSLTGAPDPFDERTDVHVSTVADIWIHLSFAVQAGERNRALTIIKARGIGHSRQVREIVISDRGVDLADVYSAGGAVIMGTMRKEKERADEAERERMRVSMESARQEFKNAEADIQLRIAALESELRARRSTIELLMREHEAKERLWEAQRISVKELRGVDEP